MTTSSSWTSGRSGRKNEKSIQNPKAFALGENKLELSFMVYPIVLKQSPHGSFVVSQLCPSVVICEAVNGDRYHWGNATETEPAFLVYLGCSASEVEGYFKLLKTVYRCDWVEVYNVPRKLDKELR